MGTQEQSALWQKSSDTYIAALAVIGIAAHFILRYAFHRSSLTYGIPLLLVLAIGGVPLLVQLGRKLLALEFGSDLLAGVSIVAAVWQGQYLVGTIVVLMLSGGAALENYATRRASAVLDALAKRMPQTAHRESAGTLLDVALDQVAIGDELVIFPHEICPVDGLVTSGNGVMDESYLTGEPFRISKAPGSHVLSGAINGDAVLRIEAQKLAVDSRYAKIMRVVQDSEQHRPKLRRLGDRLGAWYTPAALSLAAGAWIFARDPMRFLAVVVIATPCPLLIAIPVAIIGAISLCARNGIIIKDPAVLEQITTCRTLIFDKTGTLTFGQPKVTDVILAGSLQLSRRAILSCAASLEQYSKHPLATAIIQAAAEEKVALLPATDISEKPGEGLTGVVDGRHVRITGRKALPAAEVTVSPTPSGLECLVVIDSKLVAAIHFHDAPRDESAPFVKHLRPRHKIDRVMLVSGDRESEVAYLAKLVGITEVLAGQSPEDKVRIVREEVNRQNTAFIGDGINDAPALLAATVGIAFGQNSDVTTEAAGAVVMSASIGKVDELIHIGRRMRGIALQSAVGGMALSVAGMLAAAIGYLPPLQGAVFQELVDVVAVVNALRMALPAHDLTDYQ